MHEIRLSVIGHPDSDDPDRARLGRGLEADLVFHRVAEVSHPQGEAPPGAKGSALEWAQLVLGFAGSLPALVGYLRSWQEQNHGAAITVAIGQDSITLEEPTTEERTRLVEAWLERHDRP
jgi:hypothetical protein